MHIVISDRKKPEAMTDEELYVEWRQGQVVWIGGPALYVHELRMRKIARELRKRGLLE